MHFFPYDAEFESEEFAFINQLSDLLIDDLHRHAEALEESLVYHRPYGD